MPASFVFPLKVQNHSKLSSFIEWYETSFTTINPESGRKRKGNAKKFFLEELEVMIGSGKPSANFSKVVDEFKKSSILSPELQKARQTLSDADFAKLVELMEKASA
jgi:hypothetical protein